MGDDALSAGAVARRLGIAVTTLRTWHQRYGLGPSQHTPGHHRRYTPQDLDRLEVMRRLTAEGVTPAEAARWARRPPDPPVPEQATAHRQQPGTRRAGGGFAIPVGRAGPAARGLARAAMRLDAAAMRDALDRAILADGVVATWNGLVRPVLTGIGERHAATGALVEVEHLVSRCVSEALAGAARRAVLGPGPARILLACADEEQHSLPLEALAAALAEVGVGCRLLGARVPAAALLGAVHRTGPAAVAVWSHAPATADPGPLAALLASRRRPLLVLAAGPGWHPPALPPGVLRPGTLEEALALAVAVRRSLDR
ncbi:MerR family transcriptional regulator [Micromonospora sp. NPDC049559]|uniref:MerR family transcriptional regulator n=1 Tax=Micromonospora sp. NPDC049559 TaxID=3155923 RepID=UPI00342E0041